MPDIDLHHSTSVREALEQLDHELFLLYQKKQTSCRIIYGIGEGILRTAVLESLRKNPQVRSVQEDDVGGSCLVWL